MNQFDIELLEQNDWIIVCESPFELESSDGYSVATNKAAWELLSSYRKQRENEYIAELNRKYDHGILTLEEFRKQFARMHTLYADGLIEVYWDGSWKWGYNLEDYAVVCDMFDLDSDDEFQTFIFNIGIEDFILAGLDKIEEGTYQFFAEVKFHYYSLEGDDVEYDDYRIVLRKVKE